MTSQAEKDALLKYATRVKSSAASMLSNASLLYKAADALTVDAPTPAPIPARGMLHGSIAGPDFAQFQRDVPGLLAVKRSYEGAWPAAPSPAVQADAAAGLIPWVSFSDRPEAILSGSLDDRITGYFKASPESIVTWMHEGDLTKKNVTPAQFIAAHRHLMDLKRAAIGDAATVRLAAIVTGYTTTKPPQGAGTFRDWLEVGMADIYAVDPYSYPRPAYQPDKTTLAPDDPKPGNQLAAPMRSMQFLLGDFVQWCRDNSLAWAIGETGAHPDPMDLSKRAAWITETARYCEANGCVALTWFDGQWGESGPWWAYFTHWFSPGEGDSIRRTGRTLDQPSLDALRALVVA